MKQSPRKQESKEGRGRAAGFDRLLLFSSALCIILMVMHFARDTVGREYLVHQRAYRDLVRRAGGAAGTPATRYPLRLRQIVLPDHNRIDRCVSCHVGMDDPAMAEAPQPLRTHPGAYLRQHDINEIGCTLCHDGEGRALDRQGAHGRVSGHRPLLPPPFIAANCVRCHAPDDMPELETLRKGRDLFAAKQCLVCHELDGEGGRLAPDLTNLGDAHPDQKQPVSMSGEEIAARFGSSRNLAYIYESVRHPPFQPGATFMPDFAFSQEDTEALTVFLKSLSRRGAPEALQARKWRESTRKNAAASFEMRDP